MLTTSDKIRLFASDPRARYINEYPDGFVANAYRWPAPGTRFRTNRNLQVVPEAYDRKRPHGRGPSWTLVSDKGGILKRG